MAHELPTRGSPQGERTPQTDDPGLPDGPPSGEPADPNVAMRPTGMGVLATILFLIVVLALLAIAVVWALDVLT